MSPPALLLPVGRDVFAVPLGRVREVLRTPALTPLPQTPATVLGVCNLRGSVVPVLSLAGLLGLDGIAAGPYVAVVEVVRGTAGLALSGPARTATLLSSAGQSRIPGGRGRFGTVRDGVVTLLDLEELLAPERVGAATGPGPRIAARAPITMGGR